MLFTKQTFVGRHSEIPVQGCIFTELNEGKTAGPLGGVVVVHISRQHLDYVGVGTFNTSLGLWMPRLAIDENEIRPKEFKFAYDLIDELSAVVRVKNFWGPKRAEDLEQVGSHRWSCLGAECTQNYKLGAVILGYKDVLVEAVRS